MDKVVGQTKDVGFQFGIRRTFSITADKAWDFLLSQQGLRVWLGEGIALLDLEKELVTKTGVSGSVRVFKPNSHLRMSWKKKTWTNTSTLQLRVINKGAKAVISIHQEKLLNTAQREEMKSYWQKVIMKISSSISSWA